MAQSTAKVKPWYLLGTMQTPSTPPPSSAYLRGVVARRTPKEPDTLYPVHLKLSGAEVDAIDAEVDAINATRPSGRATRESVMATWLRDRIAVERAKAAKRGGR